MMKHKNNSKKILCAALSLLLLCFTLTGCKSRELSPSDKALEAVGSVGAYTVPYEELYFLATSYKSEGMSAETLWTEVSENIVTNYAILTMCEREGVSIDEQELDEAVQATLDTMIDEEFGGNRSAYLDELKATGMTDHYVRFTLRTDLLYGELASALAKNGKLYAEESDVIQYVKENFVRTWHVMIADNKGDDAAKNLATAQSLLSDLRAGKTDIYKLTKNGTNEDVLMPFDGYAIARGSMQKAYEDAAFALETEAYSEVISAKSELASGEYVNCSYIIQRLPLDDEYIDDHYAELYDTYQSAVIASMLDATKAELEFAPNDYAKGLDILSLEPTSVGTDVFLIAVLCISGAVAVGACIAVIFAVRHVRRKRAALIAQKTQRALKNAK